MLTLRGGSTVPSHETRIHPMATPGLVIVRDFPTMKGMFGLLNINKPAGATSRDVVNRVQRIVRPTKVGHAGTLDPLATGVLVVCLGAATRLIEYVQRLPKMYRATFLLGRQSQTEDIEGTIITLDDPPIPAEREIQSILHEFVGTIQQVPPAYSALKVAGRRSYELARQGKAVPHSARPVDIYALRLLGYEYPELKLEIRCGSGTYVRSLGRDIAKRLGTAAVMSALERTAIGAFNVNAAISVDELNQANIGRRLLPPNHALSALPCVELNDMEIECLRFGRKLADRFGIQGGSEAVAVDANGGLVAILAKCADGRLRPKRNFVGH